MISAPSIPRTDENSRLAHAQLVEKARQGGIDVCFVGDSITRRWGATDYPELLDHWRQCFHGWNAANFGWGGDTVANIRWRLKHGELDGVHPRAVPTLAGSNDPRPYPIGGRPIRGVMVLTQALVTRCREYAPQARAVLNANYPGNGARELVPVIRRAFVLVDRNR
ncbi:MAG: GDSL-type esterase/lipase family protein [Opitutaceae bacterium]